MKTFCIIPAYNEAETIMKVISKVKPLVDEVVVVDDASEDNTFKLAKQAGATVLKHLLNRGQGAALQTGNEYAINNGAKIIVHFDADGQFMAEEIKDIIAPIKAREADVVFGSRFLNKKSNIPGLKKYFILPLAKIVNRIFLGVDLTDPQSGFRAMAAKAAKKIKIEQDSMAHCSEILHKVSVGNFNIKEVPTTVIYHNFGQKFSGGIKILKDLLISRIIN